MRRLEKGMDESQQYLLALHRRIQDAEGMRYAMIFGIHLDDVTA